jgi:O-antigen ligase
MKSSFLPPSNKNSFQNVILLLVGSVPISIGVLNPLAEITLTAALLLSIVFFALNWQATTNNLQSVNKTVITLFALYFGIGALTYFTHGSTDLTVTRIGSTLHFVLIIPIFIALTNCTINKKWLYYSIICGAILNGGVALYQTLELGTRADGTINAVIFGGISMLLGFMSLASWRQFSKVNYVYLWPILGFLSGVTASLLSLSRGSWIIAPALIICTIVYVYYNITNKRRLLLALIAGLIFAFLIMLWWLWPYLQPRINTAIEQWGQYFSGGDYKTSIGYRLEIWKAALLVTQDSPLLGAGMGGRQQAFAGLLEDGRVRDISYLYHVHNQILQDGADKGLLGIASYFALMGYLIRHFFKGVKQKLENSDIHFVGLLLAAGYLFLGITNVTFNHGVFNTFFVSMIALVFCFTERRQE